MRRQIIKMAVSLVAAIFAGTILIMAVYCIPVSKMKQHILETVDMITQEGDYHEWAQGYHCAFLAGYSDAIMLGNAVYYDENESLVHRSMMNPRLSLNDGDEDLEQAEILSRVITGSDSDKEVKVTYPRYWHGYLVFLKPMLLMLT